MICGVAVLTSTWAWAWYFGGGSRNQAAIEQTPDTRIASPNASASRRLSALSKPIGLGLEVGWGLTTTG